MTKEEAYEELNWFSVIDGVINEATLPDVYIMASKIIDLDLNPETLYMTEDGTIELGWEKGPLALCFEIGLTRYVGYRERALEEGQVDFYQGSIDEVIEVIKNAVNTWSID